MTLYFFPVSNAGWATAGNWYEDAGMLTPAANVPWDEFDTLYLGWDIELGSVEVALNINTNAAITGTCYGSVAANGTINSGTWENVSVLPFTTIVAGMFTGQVSLDALLSTVSGGTFLGDILGRVAFIDTGSGPSFYCPVFYGGIFLGEKRGSIESKFYFDDVWIEELDQFGNGVFGGLQYFLGVLAEGLEGYFGLPRAWHLGLPFTGHWGGTFYYDGALTDSLFGSSITDPSVGFLVDRTNRFSQGLNQATLAVSDGPLSSANWVVVQNINPSKLNIPALDILGAGLL